MTGRTSRWTWPPPHRDSGPHPRLTTRCRCGRLEPASWPDAIEVDRVIPASGNMTIGPQQFWLRPSRAGQTVTAWIDTTTCHLSIGGWQIKTVPSRLSVVDLARLRRNGARPAGTPPADGSPGVLAARACVEVERVVSASGVITLGNRVVLVGSPLAGQRARIRLEGRLMHVITQDASCGAACPAPSRPASGTGCKGVRLATPEPVQPPAAIRIQRRVSSRGGIQVTRQRVQVGMSHAGKTITIDIGDTSLRILDQHDDLIKTVPRTSTAPVSRFKAYGTRRTHEQTSPASPGYAGPPRPQSRTSSRWRAPGAPHSPRCGTSVKWQLSGKASTTPPPGTPAGP
jgi:hypothetical protein